MNKTIIISCDFFGQILKWLIEWSKYFSKFSVSSYSILSIKTQNTIKFQGIIQSKLTKSEPQTIAL